MTFKELLKALALLCARFVYAAFTGPATSFVLLFMLVFAIFGLFVWHEMESLLRPFYRGVTLQTLIVYACALVGLGVLGWGVWSLLRGVSAPQTPDAEARRLRTRRVLSIARESGGVVAHDVLSERVPFGARDLEEVVARMIEDGVIELGRDDLGRLVYLFPNLSHVHRGVPGGVAFDFEEDERTQHDVVVSPRKMS